MNKLIDVYADNFRWLNLLIGCLLLLAANNLLSFFGDQAQIAVPAIVSTASNIAALIAFGASAFLAKMTDTGLARGYCIVGTIGAVALLFYRLA